MGERAVARALMKLQCLSGGPRVVLKNEATCTQPVRYLSYPYAQLR